MRRFEAVSATSAGVADLRKVVERARERLRTGRRTVLFIDEIHRFNKGQQDAVLPHVENATVTLLGATTENPSFEVNAALLSRSRVIRLEALEAADLRSLIDRALTDSDRGLGTQHVAVDPDAIDRLVSLCGGDARIALNSLELAVQAACPDAAGAVRVTAADIEGALQNPALLYDRAGRSALLADLGIHQIGPRAATPTQRCTGSRGCSKPARIRSSSPAGW